MAEPADRAVTWELAHRGSMVVLTNATGLTLEQMFDTISWP